MRAAPLGAVSAGVVAAAFRSLPHSTIEGIFPEVWRDVAPERGVVLAHAAAVSAGRRVLELRGDRMEDLERVADVVWAVSRRADTCGRPLAAANQGVAAPSAPLARLWRAMTVLREHRGEIHGVALLDAELEVPASEVVMAAWAEQRLDVGLLRRTRGLTDEVWQEATGRLQARGLLSADSRLTELGQRLRGEVEAATDRAAAQPWSSVSPAELEQVWRAVRALSEAFLRAGDVRAVTPVGVPWPPPLPVVTAKGAQDLASEADS